jgi:hypothetical protein
MFPAEADVIKDKVDFGEQGDLVEKMIETMRKVPFLKYAVLGFFMDYCKKNNDLVEKTLQEYELYKAKVSPGES